MEHMIRAKVVVPGEVEGDLILSDEPLSFWGGYEPTTGEITDRRHPLSGIMAAGKILALPFTRGSSTTTAVLLESRRLGNAPAALITSGVDTFLSLASVVADELYEQPIPVYALDPPDFNSLNHGDKLQVQADGLIKVTRVG